MHITFLIGNGFDIGVGMKTRFRDFFPIYQQQSKEKEPRIKRLSDEIGDNFDTWADFESALGEYTKNFNSENKQDLFDQIQDFQKEFVAYLKKQESTILFNKEEYIKETMQEGILNYFSQENLFPISSEEISKLYVQHKNEVFTHNFINFNYTSVLEKCINTVPQRVISNGTSSNFSRTDIVGKIVHVHGRCDAHPIIGVNDTSQIANIKLADDDNFAKRLVKPLINQFLKYKNDIDTTNLIDKSTIICVYGMSLGKTDKKWWDKLVCWLSASPNRQLVIFDYDEQYSASNQFDLLDKEDSIIKKLSMYCTNKTIQVDELRNRIHIAINKNIFQMDLSEYQELLRKAYIYPIINS